MCVFVCVFINFLDSRELYDVCTESEGLVKKIKLADGKLASSKKKAKELGERRVTTFFL